MRNIREKISIIVPIFNTEEYLETCINSIINQKYMNLEIILVNDCSTDSSIEICKKYKNMDNRIIVIDKKTNTGLSDSRNVGIEIATGEYIGFVDSDDWIHEDMFGRLIYTAKEYDCEISRCEFVWRYDEEQNMNSDIYSSLLDEYILSREDLLQKLLLNKHVGSYVWVNLFKKDLFNDIKFPKGRTYEDIATLYKLYNKVDKVVNISQPLYFYRQRNNSIVHSITKKNLSNYLLSNFERYYNLKNSTDDIQLYNVYSIFKALIISIDDAIKTSQYEFLNEEIRDYFSKMKNELYLVNEKELFILMDEFDKEFFYMMKLFSK